MKFSSFLHPHLIKTGHKVTTLKEVVNDLVKEICRDMPGDFEKKVIEIITRREQESPTAMDGIAIPHARIQGFSDLIVSISIPEKSIIVNNQRVNIFFLIVTAKTSPLYLNVLSAIAKLRQNKTLFEKIIKSKSPEELIKNIEESGI